MFLLLCATGQERNLVRRDKLHVLARTLTLIPKPTGNLAASVVLYALVSSKEQREEGYSIEAQLQLLRDIPPPSIRLS